MTTFSPAYRMRVYQPRSQDINETTVLLPTAGSPLALILPEDAEDLSTWSVGGTPVLTSGQTDPVGGTTAYTVEDDDAAVREGLQTNSPYMTSLINNRTYTLSLFMKAGPSPEANGNNVQLNDNTAATNRLLWTTTWAGGVPTVASVTTGKEVSVTQVGTTGWYRFVFNTDSNIVGANDNNIILRPGTADVTDVGDVRLWGVQFDEGFTAKPYSANRFEITTLGPDIVPGYLPYMGTPTGRRGKLNPLTGRSDTGTLNVPILDARTTAGGTNLERWVTAYMGNVNGEPLLLGLRVQIDESTDGGTTWATWYTGRISNLTLKGKVVVGLEIRDARDDLKVKCFVGRPSSSVTYADNAQLLPVGSPVAFGTFPAAGTFGGDIADQGELTVGGFIWPWTFGARRIVLDSAAMGNTDANIITTAYRKAEGGKRVRAKWVGGGTGEFWAKIVALDFGGGGTRAVGMIITELSSGDPDYLAFPANGTTGTVSLVDHFGAPSKDAPLIIGDVHPATLANDILAGKFGHHYDQVAEDAGLMPTGKSVGDPYRVFPVASSVATIIADTSIPLCRFVIDKTWDMLKFIEEQICAPFGLGYRINEAGEFDLLDMRINSTTVGSPSTIADADLDTSADIGFGVTRQGAVNVVVVKYYTDELIENADIPDLVDGAVDIPATKFRSVQHEVRTLIGQLDMGEQVHGVDAMGFRVSPDEISDTTIQPQTTTVTGQIEDLTENVRLPYGSGVTSVSLTCRRTANVTGCMPGDWRVVDVDAVLDANTNKRGGARLMRCVGRSPQGVRIKLDFLDAGPNTVLTAPTVGTLAAGTIAEHEVDVPLTENANADPMQVWCAVTATSVGTIPVAASALWVLRGTFYGTATVTIGNLPSDMRVWFRARSVKGGADEVQVPSGYAFASGNDYRDTVVLGAPTSVTVTPATILTTSTILGAWTNPVHSNGLTYAKNLYVNKTVDVFVRTVAAGTTEAVLNAGVLDNSLQKLKVYEVDPFGGVGTAGESALFTVPPAFAGGTLTAPTLTLA